MLFLLCFTTIVFLGITAGQTQSTGTNCLQTSNKNGLPSFQGYGYRPGQPGEPARRIHHQHQAIISSYKFNCCGNITEWGVDLNPDGFGARFDFILQVWRPSPTVNVSGCYSLVNDFISREITVTDSPPSKRVARITPLPQEQLQFQPGDVLGFYVESHGQGDGPGGDADNGVVLVNNDIDYRSESVWFASIDITTQTSLSVSCPYPVGTNGVLNSLTQAAPVISIKITTTSYPTNPTTELSFIQLSPSSSFQLLSHSSYYSLPHSSPRTTYATGSVTSDHQSTSTILLTPSPGHHSLSNIHSGLIAGIIVTIMVVCISTLIAIAAIVVKKRITKKGTSNSLSLNTSMALSNQVYGVSEKGHNVEATYECPINSLDCKPISKRSETVTAVKESVQYHSVGPDASKPRSSAHVYVGDPLRNGAYQHDRDRMDAECCVHENSDTKMNHEATVYDIPREELFDTAGVYVPTAEERLGGDYEMQNVSTSIYSKLKFFVEDQIYWSPASSASDLYSQLASKKYREIPRQQIKILTALGSGEFGNVSKALWSISGATKVVAVKTLKPGSSENDRVRFLQEAAIMGQFNHPYVVKLYGVVTVEDPKMICIELMSKGDLRGYLGSVNSNKYDIERLELQLLRFSRQIASGMAYLSKKAFVHRDLAARNILLDETLICKISDFGMARDLADDTYYTVQSKSNKIPVKWTAPEALFYKKYSTDSDVWSFGMVLFEIWSVGKKPFSEITNKEVVNKISSGYCQPPPPGCPRPIYQLMINCWNPTHSERPSFSKISATLNASSSTMLQWTGDNRSIAGELGGQLSEAQFLYQELQNTYNNISCSLN